MACTITVAAPPRVLSVTPTSLNFGSSVYEGSVLLKLIIVTLFADQLGSLSATLNVPNNATGSPQAAGRNATVIKRPH